MSIFIKKTYNLVGRGAFNDHSIFVLAWHFINCTIIRKQFLPSWNMVGNLYITLFAVQSAFLFVCFYNSVMSIWEVNVTRFFPPNSFWWLLYSFKGRRWVFSGFHTCHHSAAPAALWSEVPCSGEPFHVSKPKAALPGKRVPEGLRLRVKELNLSTSSAFFLKPKGKI